MSRMMQGIKVHCPYHKPAGSASTAGSATSEERSAKRQKREDLTSLDAPSCDWSGTFGDLLAKHLAACPCRPMPCPNGCGAAILRGELVRHEATCPKKCERCTICGELVRPGTMVDHRTEKAELHVQLLEQKLADKEAEAAARESLANVSNVAKQRAEEVQRDVQSLACKKVMWRIPSVTQLLRDYPKGSAIKSATFGFGGFPGFRLHFYPNGGRFSEVGTCALALARLQPWPGVHLQVIFTINSVSYTLNPFEEWHRGQGCFMTFVKQNDEFVTIMAEVVDSALLVGSS